MLKNIYRLNYKIILLTGMHIGGSSDNFDIGGADAEVIKNALTKEPYIPGSSIKGKIKSLFLYRNGINQNDKLVFPKDKDDIKKLFEPTEDDEIKVTRCIFRDAVLSADSKEKLEKTLGKGIFTEIKAENSINPIKGKAANPRMIERVPATTEFDGVIDLMVFDDDNEETLKDLIKEGLEYLELNYLGGSGSRGYGKVKIKYQDFEEQKWKLIN